MKKIVVVSGTSRGLGLEIARRLLESGYGVVGISRTRTPIDQEFFFDYQCDFSDISALVEIVNLVLAERGEIYALVNNAAAGHDGLLSTQHNSEIENLIQVNLLAPIILAKYFSRSMLIQNQGRIVNISSVVANTGYRGLSVYASTKGGLVSFSKSLARDLGSANITVNSILPGFMVSEMTKKLPPDRMKKITSRSPLHRLTDFEDISSLVEYLLSESGNNITGASFTVDAGNSA